VFFKDSEIQTTHEMQDIDHFKHLLKEKKEA